MLFMAMEKNMFLCSLMRKQLREEKEKYVMRESTRVPNDIDRPVTVIVLMVEKKATSS